MRRRILLVSEHREQAVFSIHLPTGCVTHLIRALFQAKSCSIGGGGADAMNESWLATDTLYVYNTTNLLGRYYIFYLGA